MSIDLTQEQCQALLRGEAVRISLREGGEPVVLLAKRSTIIFELRWKRMTRIIVSAKHFSKLRTTLP